MNIHFTKHVLSNGLRVIFQHDNTTPLVAVNVLYDVGARDEHPDRTGFAHLFEHLMFGGSKNIPSYDTPLQKAGGENNAFTSNDITNYYIVIPKENIETAFWLESDRMLGLNFSNQSLEVQKKVVIEEFKQRYFNQPYGDIYLLLRPLCYKVHPYRWATIGKDISHIADATLEDVKNFYETFYNPGNAILSISGNIDEAYVMSLVEKWFGSIDKQHSYIRNLPSEPEQTEHRFLEVERDVPQDCVVISYPMCGRLHNDYYTWDILSDLLAAGNSSRLFQSLVKEKQLFSDIDAYITGSIDPGQFIIKGNLLPGVSFQQAEDAIAAELEKIKTQPIPDDEMMKLVNQAETVNAFRNVSILSKAMNLAFFELLGDAAMLNEEIIKYRTVTKEQIQQLTNEHLVFHKSSVLRYAVLRK